MIIIRMVIAIVPIVPIIRTLILRLIGTTTKDNSGNCGATQ